MGKKALKHFFDKLSLNYDEYLSKLIPAVKEISNDVSKALRGANRILDLGCSTGFQTSLLTRMTIADDVIGIDFSTGMLTVAHKNFHANYRISLIAADIEHLPFKENSFEGISCCFVITMLNELHRALEEMRRVLTKGGKLVIADIEPSGKPPKTTNSLFSFSHKISSIQRSINCHQMEAIIRKSNFTVSSTKRYRCSLKGIANKALIPNTFGSPKRRLQEDTLSIDLYMIEASSP